MCLMLCHPLQSELSPHMVIEHPLRCLVLCAQVHAGMWRRNGFSLVNQVSNGMSEQWYWDLTVCTLTILFRLTDLLLSQCEV